MGKKYYPTTRKTYAPTQRNPKPSSLPTFKGSIPNIFHENKTQRHEVAKGRVHCVAVEKTAIYKDAYGNKIILKENQTNMNVPDNMSRAMEFYHKGDKWRRN